MTQNRATFDLDCSILSDTVHQQQGGTCYAHAIATVLASAERRIEGRIPKDHWTIVSEITKKYGHKGGDTATVLEDECKKRQLRFEKVQTTEEAKDWIKKKHALAAIFDLERNQWLNLYRFLAYKAYKIMTMDHIGKQEACRRQKKNPFEGSHVVAIGGYDEKENCWIIKNSWGKRSGYRGYWRVSADKGLKFNYFLVYFTLEDLTDDDIFNYIIKYGFNKEIQVELGKRGKIKEFEKRYCDMIYQKMLNKLCETLNVLRT